jgi:hypothetical protein
VTDDFTKLSTRAKVGMRSAAQAALRSKAHQEPISTITLHLLAMVFHLAEEDPTFWQFVELVAAERWDEATNLLRGE